MRRPFLAARWRSVTVGLCGTQIWGVGPSTASKLYKAGLHTIKDLEHHGKHLLSAQQLVGLCHYRDLAQRIPRFGLKGRAVLGYCAPQYTHIHGITCRAEMQEIEAFVCKHAQEVLPGVSMTVCGSYRRYVAKCRYDLVCCVPHAARTVEQRAETRLPQVTSTSYLHMTRVQHQHLNVRLGLCSPYLSIVLLPSFSPASVFVRCSAGSSSKGCRVHHG